MTNILAAVITGVSGIIACLLTHYLTKKQINDKQQLPKNITPYLKKFKDTTEMDLYFAARINQAESQVCSLMWQDDIDDIVEFDETRKMRQENISEAIEGFCKNRQHIYKELFTFTYKNRYNFMIDRINFGDNYKWRYYDNFCTTPDTRFPKLQFRIIDNEEVIFASRGYLPYLCAIKDGNLAGIMRKYFDMAWNRAIDFSDASDEKKEQILDEIKNGIKKHISWLKKDTSS